jgi:hypothetical protein
MDINKFSGVAISVLLNGIPEITSIKSQATGDLELKIPTALQKMTGKIERSGICVPVSHGSGQAQRSLVVG